MSLSVKPPKGTNSVKKELKLRQHTIGFEKTTFDSADYFSNEDNSEPVQPTSMMSQPDNAYASVALFSEPAPNTYHGVSMLLGKIQEQAKLENPSLKEESVNRNGRRVPELLWSDPLDIIAQQSTKAMLQGLSYEKRKKYHELRRQPKLKLFDSADFFLTLDAVENIEKVGFEPKSLALKDLGDETTTDEMGSDKKEKSVALIKHQQEKSSKQSGLPLQDSTSSSVPIVSNPVQQIAKKPTSGPTFQSIDTPEKVPPHKSKTATDAPTKTDPYPQKSATPQIARTFEEEKQKQPKELPPARKTDSKQSGRNLVDRLGDRETYAHSNR